MPIVIAVSSLMTTAMILTDDLRAFGKDHRRLTYTPGSKAGYRSVDGGRRRHTDRAGGAPLPSCITATHRTLPLGFSPTGGRCGAARRSPS